MTKAVFVVFAAALAPSFALAQASNPALDSEMRLVKARALPLESVRLTGGPLKHAQDLELEYLLALEPNRMLAFLRRSAKLEPKAQGYGGWDGDGRQLTGHIAGHYLSGVSLAWAATGDPRFKERADYIVSELQVIQKAQGDGYVGALMDRDRVDGKTLFQQISNGIIRSGGFDPERHVVSVVRATQDLRGPARCLPVHGKPRGFGRRNQVCDVGGKHSGAA